MGTDMDMEPTAVEMDRQAAKGAAGADDLMAQIRGGMKLRRRQTMPTTEKEFLEAELEQASATASAVPSDPRSQLLQQIASGQRLLKPVAPKEPSPGASTEVPPARGNSGTQRRDSSSDASGMAGVLLGSSVFRKLQKAQDSDDDDDQSMFSSVVSRTCDA